MTGLPTELFKMETLCGTCFGKQQMSIPKISCIKP